LVIKDLDPDWIRVRIRIVHPKMLDPDEMNTEPQPCRYGNPNIKKSRF